MKAAILGAREDAHPFDISRLKPEPGTLFLLNGPLDLRPEQAQRIRAEWDVAWARAGIFAPPRLIVVAGPLTLEALRRPQLLELRAEIDAALGERDDG